MLAVQRAQLYDEVMAMPMGFDTMLSDGGGGTSGGRHDELTERGGHYEALVRDQPRQPI